MNIKAMVFGLQLAGKIYFRSSDVTMNIDAPRHDNHAFGINALGSLWYAGDDLAVLYAELADLAIDIISRVIDPAIHNTERGDHIPSLCFLVKTSARYAACLTA